MAFAPLLPLAGFMLPLPTLLPLAAFAGLALPPLMFPPLAFLTPVAVPTVIIVGARWRGRQCCEYADTDYEDRE